MLTEQKFITLYQQYYQRSYRYVSIYVRNDMAAEDIVSEALIKLWEAIREEQIDNPLAYLMTILKNRSLDFLRAEERRAMAMSRFAEWQQREMTIRIETLESCDPATLFTSEIMEIQRKTLQSLPFNTRKIFEECQLNGKSTKEVALMMDMSVKGVDYHIAQARKALQIALKDYIPLLILLNPDWMKYFL